MAHYIFTNTKKKILQKYYITITNQILLQIFKNLIYKNVMKTITFFTYVFFVERHYFLGYNKFLKKRFNQMEFQTNKLLQMFDWLITTFIIFFIQRQKKKVIII